MSEESSAKGSRLGRTGAELAAAGITPLPELRFRADAPSVVSEGAVTVDEAVRQLQASEKGVVVVRGPDGEPEGVLVSTGRYLNFAGFAMRQEHLLRVPGPRGRVPIEDVFIDTMTEQVDLNQPWGGPGNPVLPLPPQ